MGTTQSVYLPGLWIFLLACQQVSRRNLCLTLSLALAVECMIQGSTRDSERQLEPDTLQAQVRLSRPGDMVGGVDDATRYLT